MGGTPPVELPVYGDFDPPSCAPELACAGDDCCASLLVSGDAYLMGRGTEQCADCVDGCPIGTDGWCDWDEQPEHPAEVDAFYLDKFEVTVGRFRKFVDDYERWHIIGGLPAVGDGAGKHTAGWPEGGHLPATVEELRELLICKDDPSYDNWTQTAAGNENLPMNCVDWWLSFAFCAWDGGRLPTEAEWELAAAGGRENRVYPWGDAVPTDLHANFWWGWDTGDYPMKAYVGSFPLGDGRYGHADLAGNVFEWVLDSYSAYRTPPAPCVNCVDVSGFGRVIRGGAWTVESWFMRSSARLVPAEGGALYNDNLGFRCARDVPESE
jgi:formylglycine-generating enzyme required for sulfatase activity